ncbi:Uncharacterized protein ACO02O_10733 [Dirofilaria immitis]
MIWFKTNVIIAISLIVSLNAKEVSANINKYMAAEYFDDDNNNNNNNNNNSDDKLKRIVQEISAQHVQDKSRTGDSILDEQLKWINDHETSNSMSSKDRNVLNGAIIHSKIKKYDTSRLCGSKLVDAIIKLCNGCVKPIGGKAVTTKRSLRSYVKRGQTLTEKCCINRCSFEEMKSYCC